jgi:hypothetical protein
LFEELVGRMFNDSVAWVNEGKWQKLYAAFIGTSIGFVLLLGILVFGSVFAAGGAAGLSSASVAASLLTAGGIMGIFVLIVLFIPVSVFLNLKLLEHALAYQGYKTQEIILPTILRFIALGILAGLQALFCWKEKKWLALGVAALFFGGAGIISAAFFGALSFVLIALAALLSLPYFFGVVKHGVKFSLSRFYFVRGSGVRQSLQQSWDATNGVAWAVFGALLVFGLAWGVVQSVVERVLGIIPYLGIVAVFALIPAWTFISTYGVSGLFASIDRPKAAKARE